MKRIRLLPLALVFAPTAFAQTFHLTDLGTLGGSTSIAAGINASGQIVGRAALAGGNTHAFLFSGGSMNDLGTFGGTKSEAAAINASGEVVGDAYTAGDAHQHAFKYTGGSLQDIGTLGGTFGQAWGVNASGQIVGISNTSANAYRAFLYSGGSLQNLGTLGGDFSYALGINDSGLIVGDANTAAQSEHGFLYSGGMMHDLGTLPNGPNGSTAFAINASGQIAGYSYAIDGTGLGFLITGGNMQALGVLPGHGSLAHSVNSAGVVVGASEFNLAPGSHGFYWSNGTITDLNSMLDASGSGWTIQDGAGINDNGWIAATATNAAGASHAVLLRPTETVSGVVNLQNYNAGAVAGTMVTVEIRPPGSTTPLDSQTVALDASGDFSLTTSVPPGTYDVAAKASHWLRQRLSNQVILSSGLSGLSFVLANGDVNGDNVVSLADFGQLRAAFGSTSGGSNWNPNADLNGDGVVSLADFGILRANFGKQGDP